MKNLGYAIAAVAVFAMTPAMAGEDSSVGFNLKPYVQVGAAVRQDRYTAGGFNTIGFFTNVPDLRKGNGGVLNAALGLDDLIQMGPLSLRLEVEAISGSKERFVTGSFPGAPTPSFFYRTSVETSIAGMANAWFDVQPFGDVPITLSAGGGIGYANTKISTNDFVVGGTVDTGNVIWSVGAQAAYDVTDYLTVGMQAKYINYGTTTIQMITNAGSAPAGTYSLAHESTYGGVFVRVNFLSLFGGGS